ncbi:MAG: hypothetical protein K9K67_04460 [Bacteriovoracaceae bacterium]|nr:hypothetical protein [Bacteriovoracaceae bacterium]
MKETFFLQVTPGFEKLAKQEFALKFPVLFPAQSIPESIIEQGGLSVELPLASGFQLNYWLKIPNRILLRFAHFKCRDIPKLFNKVSKLNWSPYYAGQNFEFHISSHESRLFDSRKIEKSLRDALEKTIKNQEPKKKARQRVEVTKDWHLFCRFEDDWCTISIDTSGERLGKRGYKQRNGLAPLRENLAAGLYLHTLLSSPTKETFEFEKHFKEYGTPSLTLVDPFCGSGTLLLEAALFYEPNLFRNFAFEFFPLWESKNTPMNSKGRPSAINLDLPLFLVGSDINEDRILDTQENFKESGLHSVPHSLRSGDIQSSGFGKKMALDIFSNPQIVAWCMTNPPYGKRIKQPMDQFQLLETLKSWGPWQRIGLLLPQNQKCKSLPEGITLLSTLNFENGGEKVSYFLYERELSK